MYVIHLIVLLNILGVMIDNKRFVSYKLLCKHESDNLWCRGKLLISIKHVMNSSRIELLWLVWDQSRSKYYLRTKFQDIFASQGLRSTLLIFTLGIVRRIFVIPAHCHLLDSDSYAPCNDVIFSQLTQGFHFLSFECPENWLEIIIWLIFKQRFVKNLI